MDSDGTITMALFVIGDIHGQYDRLIALLRSPALVNSRLAWTGRDATLWFMGDYVDRGLDGIDVIDLVMRLQREAKETKGFVGALLGNHDPLLLSAYHFPDEVISGPHGTFKHDWEVNGGNEADLERLTEAHVAWLSALPAMVHVGGRLFMHADTTFYARHGDSIEAVNDHFTTLLHGRDISAWDRLLEEFSEHDAFVGKPEVAGAMLIKFGGMQIVHGHTPISKMTGQADENVTEPLMYADG